MLLLDRGLIEIAIIGECLVSPLVSKGDSAKVVVYKRSSKKHTKDELSCHVRPYPATQCSDTMM